MPSSIERSAPAENASLPEVTTTPLTAASAEVCFTIASSSVIVVSSSTFIERPGISHVTSAMPSASVSTLKFLKAMCVLPGCRQPEGAAVVAARGVGKGALRAVPTIPIRCVKGGHASLCPPYGSNPFDDGRGAHAAADAQRDQRGRFVGALEFVEHGAENHRTGGAERMAERDGAAIDIDLGVVDVEFLHARALEQLFGDVDRAGQHHRRLRADIGKRADSCTRLQAVFCAR